MRVVFISFLMIGSISCFPQQQQQGSGGGQPWWWFASSSGQDSSKPNYGKPAGQTSGSGGYSSYPVPAGQTSGSGGYSSYPVPAGQTSGSGGYSSYPVYYSGTNTVGGDSGSSYGVQQQSSPQDSQQGGPGSSGPYQSTEESWSSSSDTSGEDEPVLTPVDDEDQVYAFKSRSRYNRKRLSFSQFRYTPTEPRFSRDPVFHGNRPQPQDPVKGGY